MSQPPSKFDTLRTWNGEQSRAFEEISFQLLKHQVPAGTRAIRTGNPDGGVEWYATLPDGTEWGWQAKHVKGIDALLTAMTASVKRVAKERPALRKLTFVISWNLSTGTAGRAGRDRKSQRQKYEDKTRAWRKTVAGAAKMDFELLQESDLLDELAKPEHNGRRWFWWDELVLGPEWLAQRHREQASAAGAKYRPDLQVDVPIQDDLLALGFDPSTLGAFDRLRRAVLSSIADLRLWFKADDPAAKLYEAIRDTATALKSTASEFTPLADDPPTAIQALVVRLSACSNAIDVAMEHEHRLEAEWRNLSKDDQAKVEKPPDVARAYNVRELHTALDDLRSWIDSSVGQSVLGRMYFLTGQAGSGKTHLFLDAVRRALDANRPAIFLPGAQFGNANLWSGIADQLGLPSVGADVLLSAMDAAGEAAATSGRRFVVFIDALNETTPPDFWRVQLPQLRADVESYPHVALAVSCRDTYQDLVLDGDEGSHYVRRVHPGFAEREIDATSKYFGHYGLEAPKIPLLTPEFTLPLFLRLFCEAMSSPDAGPIPSGHQGRVAIFERYLAAKINGVARRFRPGAMSGYELVSAKTQLRRVIDGLLDEMSRLGSESIRITAAEAIARSELDDPASATRVLGLLQEEGVLTRERLYLRAIGDDAHGAGVGSGAQEGVRIAFQSFSDFLLLKRRFARSGDPVHDPDVKSWLAEECSWGISEAATIFLPEVYGVELPDLLRIKAPTTHDRSDDEAAWKRYNRARQLYRSLVEMLPYRDSKAISQRTIDLLNDAQPHFSREEFYRVLFTVAPQPANRLNGDGLHRYLNRRRMPSRDRDFGFATYHELSDPFSPAARLARWAAAGPYPEYDPEVVELACIPLCWLLSSPNRFMRDWVTKALVQLLHGHLDVMRRLVERFWSVDDPYVVQRVVVIAYGSLLRSAWGNADQAKMLAEVVHRLIFTRPIRPDELLLDAGRGIVRWAVGHHVLSPGALDSSQRPYGLKPPDRPPSEAAIESKYGFRPNQSPSESYSSIYFSVLGMGDFGRYVVESGVRHFSRFRTADKYPERQEQAPRFVKSRWKAFVSSLDKQQRQTLAGVRRDPKEQSTGPLDVVLALSDAQRKLWYRVYKHPNPMLEEYPAHEARRWVFRRTLSRGWTPKLFGEQDRHLGYGRGREEHKAERWGKKYQWMAYHELLARVADNYQASRLYNDRGPYLGLHQLIGDREIDPSLPPIDYRAFNERGGTDATSWGAPQVRLREWPPTRLNFGAYRGDVRRFLADSESEPSVASDVLLRDRAGDRWVVLDGYTFQVDPRAARGWRGLQQRTAIETVLVPRGEARSFLSATRGEARRNIRDILDSHGHIDCCYFGEIGRIAPACPHRHTALQPTEIGDRTIPLVSTVEQYTWEGQLLDCSIGESATAVLPSTFFQQVVPLSLDMRGPSWVDPTGRVIFTWYWAPGSRSHGLLVRASFLQEFLATHKLELVVLHWFERMRLADDYGGEHPYVESRTEAWLLGGHPKPAIDGRLKTGHHE